MGLCGLKKGSFLASFSSCHRHAIIEPIYSECTSHMRTGRWQVWLKIADFL